MMIYDVKAVFGF